MCGVELLGQVWAAHLLLFGAGAVAGTLNVVAGGGSFLTLPVMIFLGLPPTVANGTNRVAILVQNVGAVWGFQRYGVMDRSWVRTAALPALAGALIGAWVGIEIGDVLFRRILAALMVVLSLWALWNPLRRRAAGDGGALAAGDGGALAIDGRLARVGLGLGFFAAGVYGGFVQAGVGFLLLAVSTAGGLDLVRGNALKVLVVLCYTPVALALFGLAGKVDWTAGGTLAAGNLVGGLLGVRLTVLKGHAWVRRVVTAAIIAFAIKLWVST